MKTLKDVYRNMAGRVHPEEYDWKEQFSHLTTIEPYTSVDTGKLIGILLELERVEAELELASIDGPC